MTGNPEEVFEQEEQEEHAPGEKDTKQPPAVSRKLTEARLAKGLSQEDVARQLFLSPAYVQHLEGGDFHRLPKKAFIKGYLRSAARVLGISGDELVSLYMEDALEPADSAEPPQKIDEKVFRPRTKSSVLSNVVLALAGMVALLGLAFWLLLFV